MDLDSEKNEVLTAIEQSIRTALSLQVLDGRSYTSKAHDPLADILFHTPGPGILKSNAQPIDANIMGLPNDTEYTSDKGCNSIKYQPETLLNGVHHDGGKLTSQPITLSPSENTISKTIEEIQLALNAREDCFPNEPSPEEILNLYSDDLGIGPTCSPKSDKIHTHLQPNDVSSSRVRQGSNSSKQKKQQNLAKVNSETNKPNKKKKKPSKTDIITSKEDRLKELVHIYGGSTKMKQLNIDSTVGSKSNVNKKTAPNTMKHSDDSSKVGSINSRKTKKRNKTLLKKNINFTNDSLLLEKASRISSKKKKSTKTNVGSIKKVNLKVKRILNTAKDKVLPKSRTGIDKNCSTTFQEEKYYTQKPKRCKWGKNMQQMTFQDRKSEYLDISHSYKKDEKNYLNKKSILRTHIGVENSTEFNVEGLNKDYSYNETREMDAADEFQFSNKTSILCDKKLNKQITVDENGAVNGKYHFDDEKDCLKNGTLNESVVSKSSHLHYAWPTQSSRSKEVDRFFNGHLQHLPFVIGQSTSKSHNLWVNIQEALSLIKLKLQQPTKTQNASLIKSCVECPQSPSALSRLTTKTTAKPLQCPAVRSESLYDIPEGNLEIGGQGQNSWEDNPECMKVNLDPSYVRSQCSCLGQPVMNYKNVLRQIFGGSSEAISNSNNYNSDVQEDLNVNFNDQGGDSYILELKKALIKFTEDFEDMNNKYEEMLLDPNASKEELRNLEKQLENKEEEIKEIFSRFNEVKKFNARIEAKRQAGGYNLDAIKSTTSIRLAQTLRRVQQFKESLNSRPSVPYLTKHVHILNTY